MNGIDSNDLFALIVGAAATADAITKDPSLPKADREVAGLIREALKAWKNTSFRFRDWRPATPAPAPATTA